MSAPRHARNATTTKGRTYQHPRTGETAWSVTTILDGGLPKKAIVGWAAREVAEFAVANRRQLDAMLEGVRLQSTMTTEIGPRGGRKDVRTYDRVISDPDAVAGAVDWLRGSPYRSRERKADLGTAVHAFVEARILGTPAPEPPEDAAPHMAHFARFVDEWRPEFLAAVPATIDALLHSRLDALAPHSRAALQRAAVAGHHVTRGLVVALSEPDSPVDAALLDLTRRELLETVPASRDDAFCFHHALLRDVAYDSLSRATRAELHETAAGWLEDDETGSDDIVGWHLERAFADGTTVGAPVDHLRRLGDLGASRLGRAALREWRVNNISVGIELAERATALRPTPSHETTLLSCELALAMRLAGRLADSQTSCDRAIDQAAAIDAPGLAARAQIERAWVDLDLGAGSSSALESCARARRSRL